MLSVKNIQLCAEDGCGFQKEGFGNWEMTLEVVWGLLGVRTWIRTA